jgi:micrococcal nuclease
MDLDITNSSIFMNLNTFFKNKAVVTLTSGFFILFLLFFNVDISDKDLLQITRITEEIFQDFDSTQTSSTPESTNQSTEVLGVNNSTESVQVVSVTDGDTIKVKIDDLVETVRIVNMNTPETVDPRKPVECMGIQASEKMSEFVLNKNVILQEDATQQSKDRYGRLLRFVFLEDGTDVGLQMIKLGFARSDPYGSTPHEYLEAYEAAQQTAEQEELGLWNSKNCD